jgi:hypothetical protein
MQLGIPYTFIGVDGTRAVVGNSLEAIQDPDFVGLLDPESGITGLLDGADIRETASDLTESDGGSHGAFYLSRRVGTVNVIFGYTGADLAWATRAQSKFLRATFALRGDCLLRWTPLDESVERQLRLRRQTRPDIRGRWPKTCQVGLASADPFITSSSVQSVTLTPDQVTGEIGIQDPITDPITSTRGVAGQQFVVNDGDAEAWPWFRILGPITNPVLLNSTTGERVTLTYALAANTFLDVHPKAGRILLGGTADRGQALDFPNSFWWKLQPGTNDVRLLASGFSGGAAVTISWRHTWQ